MSYEQKKIEPKTNYNTVTYTKYKYFSCTGADCRDNCCNSRAWGIKIDIETKEKYKLLPKSEYEFFKKNIIEDKDGNLFLRSDINEDGYCGFLSDDGLCDIHKNHGADYLSTVCKTYPRAIKRFNGAVEVNLDLTCPVAVENTIFSRNGFEFMLFDSEVKEIPTTEEEIIAYEIRLLLLNVLEMKHLSLNEKILYITIIMRGLNKIERNNDYKSEVFKALDMYERNVLDSKDFVELQEKIISKITEDNMEKNISLIMNFLQEFITIAPHNRVKNTHFYKKLENFKEIDIERYKWAKKKLFVPYFEKNEHVFTNYLVHNIFSTAMPYMDDDLENSLAKIIIPYLMLQVFIIGVNSKEKYIGTEDIIDAVYYYHRRTNHLKTFSDSIDNNLKKENDDLINMDFNLVISLLNI